MHGTTLPPAEPPGQGWSVEFSLSLSCVCFIPWIFLTPGLFRSVLLNFQLFGGFLAVFMLLMSSLTPLRSDRVLSMVLVLFILLSVLYGWGHVPPFP